MEKIFKSYKKNVKVYIQVLPAVPLSWDYVKIHEDFTTLYIRSTHDFSKGNFHKAENYKMFETDGILYKMYQDEIFDLCVKRLLYKSIMGVDLLVFAFGLTGSGKSSTAHGLLNIYENRGLSPRIITELFEMRDHNKKDMEIKYSVSFIEIYRNYVVDLLTKDRKKMLLSAKNIKIVNISSEKEALKLLFQGESNRNAYHNETYISHLATSVFTIHVRSISTILSNPTESYAQIHIIDMAGIGTSGNKSCRLKHPLDVGLANLNKSQLEQCLLEIQKDLIKEKESIKDAGLLVQYLGKSLGPHSNIRFIGHITTSFEDLNVTVSCLKFSNTARRIHPAKHKPTSMSTADLELPKVKDELERIKEKMYLDSMLLNDDLSMRLTQPRIEQMEHVVEEYIQHKTNELTVINLIDLKNALSVFRRMYDTLNTELRESMYAAALVAIRAEEKSLTKSGHRSSKILSDASQSGQPVIEEKLQRSSLKSVPPELEEKRSKSVSDKPSKLSKSSKHNKVARRSNKPSKAEKETKAFTEIITKSGMSLEALMKHNYVGDITKSLRLKTKIYQPSVVRNVLAQLNLQIAENMNLENNLENQEIIWNNYINEPLYAFKSIQAAKEKIEEDSVNILINYETTLNIMQGKVQLIDITHHDILKVKFFNDIAFTSKCGPTEETEINKVKEKLTSRINSLNFDVLNLKEELLTLQAELKINIEEFKRLKFAVIEDFTKYCINKFHIPSPINEITEVLIDKLMVSDIKPIQKDDSKNKYRKNVFNADRKSVV